MRSWNAAGVAAGALLGFLPATVVLLPHGAATPSAAQAQAPARLVADVRMPTAAEAASAIHAQSGRLAHCSTWPGNPGQYWCSDYGGTRCFYALFAFSDGRISVKLATASPIPCKFGQSDMHASPGRDT